MYFGAFLFKMRTLKPSEVVHPKACKQDVHIRYEAQRNKPIYFMANGPSERLNQWLEGTFATRFILGVIAFNAIILGLETSQTVTETIGGLLKTLGTICLSIFVIEITLKLIAYPYRFLRTAGTSLIS